MEIDQILADFTRVAEHAQTLTFITRDKELQGEARSELGAFLDVLAVEKGARIRAKNEDEANLLLALEFACRSLQAEISMYLALKDDCPEDAWNYLIDAQSLLSAAVRAHVSMEHVTNNLRKLLAIEKLVFPPQIFMSTGSVVNKEECSVCGSDYRLCAHVAGRPYMGEMCSVICRDLKLSEVSIVDEPADKRARVTSFSDEGRRRNRMTWRLE